MSRVDDVRAVIASATTRGTAPLERFIANRFPEAGGAEVEALVDRSIEIIESVPDLLAQAEDVAAERNLQHLFDPVLALTTRYFVSPIDILPEMTHGLAGLLDDAYLVLRTLTHLEEGSGFFLERSLEEPADVLSNILGEAMTRRLDAVLRTAIRDAESHVAAFWQAMAAEA